MPQPDHIMRLTTPEAQSLDDDIRAYLDKCVEKLGMIPNVLAAFTLRPNKFRTFTRFYNELMLGESGLSKLEREMIAVVVSAANRCYYCLVAHGAAARQLSGDPQLSEMLAFNHAVAPVDPRQRAMLDFAWKLTLTPQALGEADRDALRGHGLSDEDIFDLCDVAAFFNYTNRVAHGVDMMPNPEYHGLAR